MINTQQRRVDYHQRKQRVIRQSQALLASGHQIALGKKTSNLFRNRQQASHRLDVTDFNHVIEVNADELWIEAEAMTPFSTLVEAALQYGCLPTVVPELKSITVGGGLTGVAIESSSFRYGLVHENIIESEILLSDGQVVTCRADNEYRDLFYGFPNTYGSLGYALKVRMKMIKAKPFVKLTHLHFTDPKAYFDKMQQVCEDNRDGGDIAYIDGTIFSAHDLHLTLGEFVDQVPYTSGYKWLSIYYRSIKKRDQDYLTVADYIWRWDSDWFWCSKNFLMQNFLMRLLFGRWVLNSVAFWKIMNFARNNAVFKWLESKLTKPSETVIQDIEVPIDRAVEFHHFFHHQIGIKPVWVCPVQTYDSQHAYDFYALDPGRLFVNFGFWDTVPSRQETEHYNRLVEAEVSRLGGHKSLYSDVFYSKEQFWHIYDHDRYQQLKNKYDTKAGLRDWYDKISAKSS